MNSVFRRALVGCCVRFFQLAYRGRLNAFENSLKTPRASQSATLRRILAAMESTDFGQAHGLHARMSLEEFRRRVPVQDYDSLCAWIEDQAKSTDAVLTPAPLVMFEKTSGSRGPSKWIPYNRAHLKTFERMFVLWCLDLFRSGLTLESGKVYFLISPRLASEERAPNGLTVGLADDSGYLGSWISHLSRIFFVDSSTALTKPEDFIFDLGLSLLRERSLEVISVWSPSLLMLVVQKIRQNRTALAACAGLSRETRDALDSNETGARLNLRLWPNLKLISAWDAAAAREDAAKVQANFPHAEFQGKGLLATEAAMTVPWRAAGGQVPLIDDLYFEFEDERDGVIRELHEVESGQTYQILLTSVNGFIRYRIGDRVRVGADYHATPMLEFVGRAGGVSDLVGEKLQADFVEQSVAEVLLGRTAFASVFPLKENDEIRYVLAVDDTDLDLSQLSEKIEAALSIQHHYAVARKLGQLMAARAVFVSDLRSLYYENRVRRGAQVGQIKVETLLTDAAMIREVDSAMRRSNGTSRQSRSEGAARL